MTTRADAGIGAGLLLLTLAACGGPATGPALPTPEGPGIEGARGVPGFDTRDYPGDAVMAAWRESSPYRWVGYYLPAPCYTGTSWDGRRAALAGMGWGLAVLFVGEQDWAASAPSGAVSGADPGNQPVRCTSTNLTPERGAADGRAAASSAATEGFRSGAIIFLDVERVDTVSAPLTAYVRAWVETVLADGRFVPGLYAHAANADALLATASATFRAAGRTDTPPLWVATTNGFSLRRAPTESGFPAARIWQGILDARETWGGHTLRIDANVASEASPSG
ncbi:MAG TPA: glycoside hydrolase domain-containing protein [Longimicrobiales bacterium]|nr:glycoside hydrolase domain-containing protein [Longimicrobiales bacterium]